MINFPHFITSKGETAFSLSLMEGYDEAARVLLSKSDTDQEDLDVQAKLYEI